MSHFRDGFQIGNLQLWVGQDFQEDAAGVIIDGFTHLLYIGQVAQTHLYAESAQGSNEQSVGIAEEMLRGNDVLALCSQGHESIADCRHSRIEGCGVGSIGEGCHSALQVGYRRILHTGVIGSLDLVGECFRHHGSIVEFVGKGVIYWNAQRIVSIAALVFQMNGLRLFLHYFIILCDILFAKVQKRNQIDNRLHKKTSCECFFCALQLVRERVLFILFYVSDGSWTY